MTEAYSQHDKVKSCGALSRTSGFERVDLVEENGMLELVKSACSRLARRAGYESKLSDWAGAAPVPYIT